MALRVGRRMVAAEMMKWRRVRRGGRDVRRGVSKSEWWTVCSIPILSSCTYYRSGAAGALPVWQSPESFGLNPYWLIQPKLLSPSFFPSRSARQVGTGGWKGIRPLCHVGPPSSLTSYGRATWVGNECTRLEKEKKKKMLVPQEGEEGQREGLWAGQRGVGGWEEWVTCKKNESKN